LVAARAEAAAGRATGGRRVRSAGGKAGFFRAAALAAGRNAAACATRGNQMTATHSKPLKNQARGWRPARRAAPHPAGVNACAGERAAGAARPARPKAMLPYRPAPSRRRRVASRKVGRVWRPAAGGGGGGMRRGRRTAF
jgi:hypothetical protein